MESFSKTLPPISFSYAGFFEDMPWLQVPESRKAVFVEPCHMRGGLLGGSSSFGTPKMSKLQALAAARRKKSEEQKGESSESIEKPMAKLNLQSQPTIQKTNTSPASGNTSIETQQPQKRKNSITHQKTVHPSEKSSSPDLVSPQSARNPSLQAVPSAFANTLFAAPPRVPSIHPKAMFTMPYVRNAVVEATNAFAEPSPDDVVLAAQAKGLHVSAKPR